MRKNLDYQYEPLYYAGPCQVRYTRNGKFWQGGIAYKDFIIDGNNGQISSIQEIVDSARSNGVHFDDAIVELDWAPLGVDILYG